MKHLLITALIFLFPPKIQGLTLEQTTALFKNSVLVRAKQYTFDEETNKIKRGMTGCSGTFVTFDMVLTAAHCFANPTTDVWVRDINGLSTKASMVKIDPDKDLALLKVLNQKPHSHTKLASSIRVGEKIVNIGSPFFFEFIVSEGIVATTNIHVKQFKGKYVVTTAMINPGSSGGGAFNEAGELLGVNTLTIGGRDGWNGISLAVDLDTIKNFLENVYEIQ